jgi:hypothetical protein
VARKFLNRLFELSKLENTKAPARPLFSHFSVCSLSPHTAPHLRALLPCRCVMATRSGARRGAPGKRPPRIARLIANEAILRKPVSKEPSLKAAVAAAMTSVGKSSGNNAGTPAIRVGMKRPLSEPAASPLKVAKPVLSPVKKKPTPLPKTPAAKVAGYKAKFSNEEASAASQSTVLQSRVPELFIMRRVENERAHYLVKWKGYASAPRAVASARGS